jgi:hypothetical protein
MKSAKLLERTKQPFWRSHLVEGAGTVVLCIAVCFLLMPTHAAGGKLENRNKALVLCPINKWY